MENPQTNSPDDPWSHWLLHRRHGGDPKYEEVVRVIVDTIRDRVLDGAKFSPGQVLVDAGAGDGLIAFGAFERVGPSLQAIFTDISAPLLERAEQTAAERGLRERCSFLKTSAEELAGVADQSADVVTSRAVLAYVADKQKALAQFYRVLKPGGRISIGEPINRDDAMNLAALTRYLELQPNDEANMPVRLFHRWRAAQLPSTKEEILGNPLTNFTERDLVKFCRLVGFRQIHLELHIDDQDLTIESWDVFLNVAPRPNTPTLREVMANTFSEEERVPFEAKLRQLFEAGFFRECNAVAYLTAVKPA
jgi:ubiquinone/menaquinone biosynthesis C-methylase UbiE